MEILITAPSLSPLKNVSGISSVVTNIIQYNKQHNFHHYILGKPDQSLSKVIWLLKLLGKLLYFPFFLKRNKIELVHQNLPFNPKGVSREFIINCWCLLTRVPVMLHIHGGSYLTKEDTNLLIKKLAQFILRHSKQVIVLSNLEHEILKDNFGISTSKVLSNSIDTSIFNSQQIKCLKDKPVLLYLGRIEKNKGIYELIEALKLLKIERDFYFILCGTGILTEYSFKEFKKILGNDFEYRGVVSGEDKINVIKQSNIFILPSYFEGLPMALLETMADGVVPIVTHVGSMKFVVQHKINGIKVNKKDAQDLFEKLKMILNDAVLYQNLSINAQKTVVDQHDISSYVVQLNELYKSAIQ